MNSTASLRHSWIRFRTWTGGLTLLEWLRIIWLFLVYWLEVVRYSLSSPCYWDDQNLLGHTTSKPTHILLLTDARVRYTPLYKHDLFGGLYEWLYELDLRRTWNAALSLRPHMVVFLGDMLASGRKVKSSSDFRLYYESFRRLFSINKRVHIHYIPGNEDIGLNLKTSDAQRARANYISHFGAPNNEIYASNHTLILLDAPGLVEEDYLRTQNSKDYQDWTPVDSGPVEFVKSLEHRHPEHPRILFSHIPLARSETASCGPLRSEGGIHRGAGPGYQNMLGKQTTEFLLQTVRPAVVFSGDDRDYCETRHSIFMNGSDVLVPEITIQSFSPVKDAPAVGFHLLSLVPPHEDPDLRSLPTFSHTPCFLPAPIRVYGDVYLPMSVLTLLVLLAWRYWRPHHARGRHLPSIDGLISPLSSVLPPGTSRATVAISPFVDFARGHKTTFSRSHRLQISVDRTHEAPPTQSAPSWAWTFTFRGRRRRIVLRRPHIRMPFVDRLVIKLTRRLDALPWIHSRLVRALLDLLLIVWPSVALWTVLAWWTMP